MSAYSEEREVLFNPFNNFEILECHKNKEIKFLDEKRRVVEQYIVLEYAPLECETSTQNSSMNSVKHPEKLISFEEIHRVI